MHIRGFGKYFQFSEESIDFNCTTLECLGGVRYNSPHTTAHTSMLNTVLDIMKVHITVICTVWSSSACALLCHMYIKVEQRAFSATSNFEASKTSTSYYFAIIGHWKHSHLCVVHEQSLGGNAVPRVVSVNIICRSAFKTSKRIALCWFSEEPSSVLLQK